MRAARPIGVFDSGLGGLTVVRELHKRLPNEHIVYFGDTARLPYGIKSTEQIRQFSRQNSRFLMRRHVKAIVIACNSSSSAAYEDLRREFAVPVVDVIVPAAKAAAQASRSGRIGLIATQATIDSGAYERALKRFRRHSKVFKQSCPLFVPIVEEGLLHGPITESIIRRYLLPLKKKKIDTLILGCTHYPLLKDAIRKVMGRGVQIVDSARPTVQELASLLQKKRLSYSKRRKGRLEVSVSDKARNFKMIGERFLGKRLRQIKVVRLKEGMSS